MKKPPTMKAPSDEAWGLGNGSQMGNQAAGSSADSGRTAARRASERY